MKKKTLLVLLLCAIPVAALREGGASKPLGTSAATGIAFLMPQIQSDFSDLDVRDAQNRVISSPSATQELTTLFRENIVNLTVFASPHAMTEVFNYIDSLSHLLNKLIITRLTVIFGVFQDAFLPPIRRFVHNAHNLCIRFSVGQFHVGMILAAACPQKPSLQTNLRC
jgi:hypothetical protein